MVELCVVVPVIVLLLLGTLDIGYVLVQFIIVTSSVRSSAMGATPYYMASDTADAIQSVYVDAGTFSGFPLYKATATVSCICGPGGASVPCNGTCAGSVMPAQYMTVTGNANLSLPFKVAGLPSTIPVQSVVRVRTAWTGGQ